MPDIGRIIRQRKRECEGSRIAQALGAGEPRGELSAILGHISPLPAGLVP